jgi:ATP-dependent exoDNAse (exonuclease V) alpha subunit
MDREEDRLSLAESQVTTIRLALVSKVLVITGGPGGVGKTTIVAPSSAFWLQGNEPAAVRADGARRQSG